MTSSFEDPVGLEQPADDVFEQRLEVEPAPIDPAQLALPLEANAVDAVEQREEVPEDV
ncbi:hypothetical protein [Amycolatopsis sp.]|jgi:hypothetical protein|uniref:hypothetical protein n=1 Tax=Amycolatopsis sp. TaxID=37632 RepID=UPI002E016D56|nr:hypothetical protein [Amycolatopsis sp.]